MTRSALAALIALVLLAVPAAARADGFPVGGWTIAGVAGANDRYAALPVRSGTVLERLAARGGQVLLYRLVPEQIGVPAVALDGTAGGLTRDGRTLVLSGQRTDYPQSSSRLYLLTPQALRIRRTLRLKGDFSFDAISPDGATIYLIQLNPRNPTRYAVRALDTATGRLLPKPVVDPREPDEAMRGFPLTRVTSPDGRFAYTLYSGGDKSFVHALDTVGRKAACIDIPALANSADAKLRLAGRRLTVLARGVPLWYVDTATRQVSKAVRKRLRPAAADRPGGGGGAPPLWSLFAGAAVAALGAGGVLGARRRRAGAARS